MRRLALLTAATVSLAGCGGGHATLRLADVRPCLDKLALVVVPKQPKGFTQTIDADNADLSYRAGSAGATSAHLTFYAHERDAKAAVLQTLDAVAKGTVRLPTKPHVVQKTVVLTWSSPPSGTQQRRLLGCLD